MNLFEVAHLAGRNIRASATSLFNSSMMSTSDNVPAFTKLNLPPPEEYRKRKIALISGTVAAISALRPPETDRHYKASLARMAHTCMLLLQIMSQSLF